MKKFIALIIALMLTCSCYITAFAAENKQFKLSFNTNGIQKLEDRVYSQGDKIELPSGEAEGYIFIGWYADKNFEKLFTYTEMPAQNITVYGLYAVPLSKLAYEFKDVDINKAVSKTDLTPDEFNKLAKENGFEIVCSINGKQHKVKDIVNYMDEITGLVNKEIAKGATSGMTVTIKPGQNSEGKAYTFNIYNDLEQTVTTEPSTKAPPEALEEQDFVSETSVQEDDTTKNSNTIVYIVCFVFVALAVLTIIITGKRKKK